MLILIQIPANSSMSEPLVFANDGLNF